MATDSNQVDSRLFELPKPLQELWQKSRTSSIRISLSNPREPLSLTDSKIGGMGYLPEGEEYPKDNNGNPLVMLCQLNFAQIHEAVDTNHLPYPLPENGILQIYISATDDCAYGLDNPFPDTNYQVYFRQDADEVCNSILASKAYNWLQSNKESLILPFDFDKERMITYQLMQEASKIEMYYDIFTGQIGGIKISQSDKNLLDDQLYEEKSGHKIFGQPFFTQSDPRETSRNLLDYILLLQIDTDEKNHIMWGDAGVANFFIHPDDLAKQDFCRLMYNWDCC